MKKQVGKNKPAQRQSQSLPQVNRPFVQMFIEGEFYKALVSTGASASLIGPKLIEKLKYWLEPGTITIKDVLGDTSKTLGNLYLNLDVDGRCGKLLFRAAPYLMEDIILGVDFITAWRLQIGPSIWNVFPDRWHTFHQCKSEKMYEECVVITWFPSAWEKLAPPARVAEPPEKIAVLKALAQSYKGVDVSTTIS